MPARPTDSFFLPIDERSCTILAAGQEDPVFGAVAPDVYSAYVRFSICKSLPNVMGPESASGAVFGVHPAVVARSFETLRYKQMNRGHQLKALGKPADNIVGCVLGCAYPEEPEGGWTIPESVGAAPSISGLGVLFKQAQGVDKLLGEHQSGKHTWSVSMEMTYYYDEVGIYDPVTRLAYDRADIPKMLWNYLAEDEKGKLLVRKNARQVPLVLIPGGVSGNIWFSGVGYTKSPAERTASVDHIAAESREGMMVCEVAEAPRWLPGMEAHWPPMIGGYGRGRVAAVHLEGVPSLHGERMTATPEDPVLEIVLPDLRRIIRRVSTLSSES